jgi:HSP20 family molecular chaperone IbpA
MMLRSRSRTAEQDAAAHILPLHRRWSEILNQSKRIFIVPFPYSDIEYRLDVHEDVEKNVVTATFDFPGYSNDEIQINFQNGKLTVSAEAKKSEEHAETGYTLRERLHGRLSRTLQLPEGVQVCISFPNILNEY